MEPFFVGQMLPKQFLDTFLPNSTASGFTKGMFSEVIQVVKDVEKRKGPSERAMYPKFVFQFLCASLPLLD
jgi:hypothetical protein